MHHALVFPLPVQSSINMQQAARVTDDYGIGLAIFDIVHFAL